MQSNIETFYPKNKAQWRKWLKKNHLTKEAIWVIFYKKASGQPTISWSDAVDEALCFGWIDSIKHKIDDERSIQYFSKRKPKSTWSKINKEKISILTEKGLMTPAGNQSVAIAKQNGCWDMLDSVDTLTISGDLEEAFTAMPGTRERFIALSKSAKKVLLQQLLFAKQPSTRAKRINEIITKHCAVPTDN